MENIYYSVNDVMKICGVGRNKAYEIIRKVNSEMERNGFITVDKKVNKNFFESKINPDVSTYEY